MPDASPSRNGSLTSAALILTITAIGTGVLALPYAARQLGWALGAVTIVVIGLLNIASLEILLEAGLKLGTDSYGDLLGVCQGPVAAVLLDVIVFLDCFGSIVAYWIFMGQLLPSLLARPFTWLGIIHGELTAIDVLPVLAVLVFVATMPRNISAIGNWSFLGIVSVSYLSMLLVYTAFSSSSQTISVLHALPEEHDSLHGAQAFTNACAMIVFSFLCQCNIFLVSCDLDRPTIPRLRKVTRLSTSFQMIAYITIAMCGYKSFGNDTKDNIFVSFPKDDHWVDAGKTLLCFALCISIPINIYPTRATFISLMSNLLPASADTVTVGVVDNPLWPATPFLRVASPGAKVLEAVSTLNDEYQFQQQHHWQQYQENHDISALQAPFLRMTSPGCDFRASRSSNSRDASKEIGSRSHPAASLDDAILLPDARELPSSELAAEQFSLASWVLHVGTAGGIVSLSLALAFALPSISIVMGTLGGICGVIQMYVFPALVLVRCKNLRSNFETGVLLIGFALAAAVGTSSVILASL